MDPGEFAVGRVLPTLLERLRARADLVLVDSPPMLHVGDSLALAGLIDALVVVSRLHVIRWPMLGELVQALDATRTTTLGLVVTGASQDDRYADSIRDGRGFFAPSYERSAGEQPVR
jgi:Mrp family chromosome partitioning ATPase